MVLLLRLESGVDRNGGGEFSGELKFADQLDDKGCDGFSVALWPRTQRVERLGNQYQVLLAPDAQLDGKNGFDLDDGLTAA
jgi:hypothetical protein